MPFIASGFRLALDGEIVAAPAQAEITPAAAAPEPERDVPPLGAVDDTRPFEASRSQLSTPIINSLWRHLAALALLASAWDHLGPHTRRPWTLVGPLGHRLGRWAHRSNGP